MEVELNFTDEEYAAIKRAADATGQAPEDFLVALLTRVVEERKAAKSEELEEEGKPTN